jgi:hypothetical protein
VEVLGCDLVRRRRRLVMLPLGHDACLAGKEVAVRASSTAEDRLFGHRRMDPTCSAGRDIDKPYFVRLSGREYYK